MHRLAIPEQSSAIVPYARLSYDRSMRLSMCAVKMLAQTLLNAAHSGGAVGAGVG